MCLIALTRLDAHLASFALLGSRADSTSRTSSTLRRTFDHRLVPNSSSSVTDTTAGIRVHSLRGTFPSDEVPVAAGLGGPNGESPGIEDGYEGETKSKVCQAGRVISILTRSEIRRDTI